MGKGALMKVVNHRSTAIHTYVTDVDCVHDDGVQGSYLCRFNDRQIPANSSYPSSGNGQYIEADNSGGCFFHEAKFTLKIENADTGVSIGHVNFHDSSTAKWVGSTDNEDLIDLYVTNNEPQARITVTVEGSSQ